jgi:high-affinity nickel-transport protein
MDANTSWIVLSSMALTLGIQHGFDWDHIAIIDAITRTVRQNRFQANIVGLLFSFGHGLVVTLISLIMGTGLMHSHIPVWFEGLGKWVSIAFLFIFGLLNLYDVLRNSSNQGLPGGLKAFLAKKITGEKYSPLMVVGIGAMLAFSFDTLSQIALFSISASLLSGWLFSGILGILFMLGMMISAGINGVLISAIIARADGVSAIVSRGLGLTISAFSLTVGVMSLIEVLG